MVAVVLGSAARARAEDWLAVLPECEGARAEPSGLVYPRAGLPAVVGAGELLVVRVRLRVPLTPPPGIQQTRALQGFSAVLQGHAQALPVTAGRAAPPALAHRYPLEVISVRPEGASSLRYRVTLPVPAWAAPGTYDLLLEASGMALRAQGAVRVLAQGAGVRLGALASAEVPADSASWPLDVWVRQGSMPLPTDTGVQDLSAATVDAAGVHSAEPAAQQAAPGADARLPAPVLATDGLVAALRVGSGLWVLGDCGHGHGGFADEVAGVLAVEQRVRLATPPLVALDEPAWRSAAPVQVTSAPDDSVRLQVPQGPVRELAFTLFADGRSLRTSAGALRFVPATEVSGVSGAPVLLVQLLVGPVPDAEGLEVTLARTAAPATPDPVLELSPVPVASNRPLWVRVKLQGSDAAQPARVALRFDHRSTAFAQGAVSHRFTALGPNPVSALVIFPDGRAVVRTAQAQVTTEAAVGCAVRARSRRPRPPAGMCAVGALALLMGRRAGRPRAWPVLDPAQRAKKAPERGRGNTLATGPR